MALRKCIATPPGEETKYVDLTPEEETARLAEEEAARNAPPPPPTRSQQLATAMRAAPNADAKLALLEAYHDAQ